MITLTGKIEKKGFGRGTWALVTTEDKTYELKDAPAELLQLKNTVKIEGVIRKDIMTLAMIGDVLEVISFEIID